MKKYLLLLLPFFLSCVSPKLGVDKLNLEKITFDFNIHEFYSNEIEKKEIYESQKKDRVKLLQKWGGFHSVLIDSLYKNEDSDNKKLIGIQYKMNSSAGGDSLAYFKKMYFDKVDMVRSSKDDFIALSSSKNGIGIEEKKMALKEFDELFDYLTLQYGNPEIKKDNFNEKDTIYYWLLKERLIALRFESSIINFGDVEKPLIFIQLYIINEKYLDAIIGEIDRGAWLHLK
ncbi:hypothetical protein [Cellulophaga sp. Ld12]|uniref:hypothetical protein n=1 Tax=Cellulophaga sp. Ld12 TaxID=3229535 RepID=UPI00386E2297